MNYQFFLFSKLFDVYHTTDKEYDLLFVELSSMYNDWLAWDVYNAKELGAYESMCNYFSITVPAI